MSVPAFLNPGFTLRFLTIPVVSIGELLHILVLQTENKTTHAKSNVALLSRKHKSENLDYDTRVIKWGAHITLDGGTRDACLHSMNRNTQTCR